MNQTKSIKSNWCPAPGVRASAVSPGDGSLIQTLRLGTLGPGSPETFLTTHGSAHQSQPCCWVVGFYNLLEVRWDCAAASDSHPSQRCRFGFSSPCWPTVQDSEGCLFLRNSPGPRADSHETLDPTYLFLLWMSQDSCLELKFIWDLCLTHLSNYCY